MSSSRRAPPPVSPGLLTPVSMSQIKTDEEAYDELYEEDSDFEMDAEEQIVAASEAPLPGYVQNEGLMYNCLSPYIPTQYSAQQIFTLLNMGDIDTQPDYQREVVWNQARQEALIDSIFHNYFIPPILFAVRHNPQTRRPFRTCIDGKQRLTSIQLFMDGMIPWRPSDGPGKGKRYWYKLPNKVGAKDYKLPALESIHFEMKQFTCCEFRDLPEDAERDIFQRVQMGIALSPAEKLQAMDNPMGRYVATILQKHVYAEGTGFNSFYDEWEQSRGRPFQSLVHMVQLIDVYPAEKSAQSAVTAGVYLRTSEGPSPQLRRKVECVWHIYNEIMAHHQEAALKTVRSRLSPVEWIFFGLVIHALRRHYDVPDIARLLGELRVHIRKNESNIRSNSNVMRNLYKWLTSVPRPRRRDLEVEDDEMENDHADYLGTVGKATGDRPSTRAARSKK